MKIPARFLLVGIFLFPALLSASQNPEAERHYQLANTYAQEHDDLDRSGMKEESLQKLKLSWLELEQEMASMLLVIF